MTLWLKVSEDEYELPEIVCDSCEALAWKCGVKAKSLRGMISKFENGKRSKCKYRKVVVED